jgi:hypothetical protein
MAVFGVFELEKLVQVNDKTRLSAVRSYAPKGSDAISKVEIQPDSAESYITVSGPTLPASEWYLDWIYTTSGVKTINLKVTQGVIPTVVETTFTTTINIIDEADDKLLSDDKDLTSYEPDVLKWIPQGRSSYKDVHRRAQTLILDWLDEVRVWKSDGTRIEKADLFNTEDLRKLSALWTLELIFQGISNKPDDVFALKSNIYREMRRAAQSRGRIQADFNGNAVQDEEDSQDMRSFEVYRR